MTRYFNSSNRPVRFNENGQIIGAGEWLDSEETPEIRQAVLYGELVKLPEEQPSEETPRRKRRPSKTEE